MFASNFLITNRPPFSCFAAKLDTPKITTPAPHPAQNLKRKAETFQDEPVQLRSLKRAHLETPNASGSAAPLPRPVPAVLSTPQTFNSRQMWGISPKDLLKGTPGENPKERKGYQFHLVYPGGSNEEFSIEEIRARNHRARSGPVERPPPQQQQRSVQQKPAPLKQRSDPVERAPSLVPLRSAVAPNPAPAPIVAPSPAPVAASLPPLAPTPSKHGQGTPSFSRDLPRTKSPRFTPSKRRPYVHFSSVTLIFSHSLAATALSEGTPENQASRFPNHAHPSPTINTKFALDEINSMFNKPLSGPNGLDDDDDDDDDVRDNDNNGNGGQAAQRDMDAVTGHQAPGLSRKPSFEIFFDENTVRLPEPAQPSQVLRESEPAPQPKPTLLRAVEDQNPARMMMMTTTTPAAAKENGERSTKLATRRMSTFHQETRGVAMSPIMETSAEYNCKGSNSSLFHFPPLFTSSLFLIASKSSFSASTSSASSYGSSMSSASSTSSLSSTRPRPILTPHSQDEHDRFIFEDDEPPRSSTSSKFSLSMNGAMNLSTIPMASPKTLRLSTSTFNLDRRDEEEDEEEEDGDAISSSHLAAASHLALSASVSVQTQVIDPLDPRTIEGFIGMHDRLGSESRYYDCSGVSKGGYQLVERLNESGGVRVEFPLDLDHLRLRVHRKIGRGSTSTLFVVSEEVKDDFRHLAEEMNVFALKIQRPAFPWEYLVSNQLMNRIPASLLSSICAPKSIHVYRDESYLLMEYCGLGNLEDLVTLNQSQEKAMDERLVAFYTLEVLRIIEGIHSNEVIHGDIAAENLMVRSDEVEPSEWSTNFQPDGDRGWDAKGLKLTDFGRAIDLSVLPRGALFRVQSPDREHLELLRVIRGGQPWKWEVDYLGIACVAYLLGSGGRLAVQRSAETGRWEPVAPINPRFKSEIWRTMFDQLLNFVTRPEVEVGQDGTPPDVLAGLKSRFQRYLVETAHRPPNSLKSLLRQQEILQFEVAREAQGDGDTTSMVKIMSS